MPIIHGTLKDTDPHFIIDPITRQISTTAQKIVLIQGDHNSEIFTFELHQQEIDGHDMSSTDEVVINYINIDQLTKAQSKGQYVADDVTLVPADGTNPARVIFTWRIEHAATMYQGTLAFAISFKCYEGSNRIYSWGTAPYKNVSVGEGIDNSGAVANEYADILKRWELELKANQIVSLEQTKTATADEGENVWTATFGDGRTQELKVKNGSRGPTGYVGSIETVTGGVLHFFIGTRREYDALTDAQKVNLFAIFTDDQTEAELARLFERVTALESKTLPLYQHSVRLRAKINERPVNENLYYYLHINVIFSDTQQAKHDVEYFKTRAFAKEAEQGTRYLYPGYLASVTDGEEDLYGARILDFYKVNKRSDGTYQIEVSWFMRGTAGGQYNSVISILGSHHTLEMDSVTIIDYTVVPIT